MEKMQGKMFLNNVMPQTEEMNPSYNEEMKKLQDISEERDRIKTDLEARRNVLNLREKELNRTEKKNLDNPNKRDQMAILEQQKADVEMLKLVHEQKSQKEVLHKKIIEVEAKLEQRHALQLEIERMRGAVEIMKHMMEEGDIEDKKKLESIEEDLKDKEKELEGMESLNQNLAIKDMAQVEAKFVKKQALEMEVDRLREAIKVMKLVPHEGAIQMVESLEKELKDKEEELEVEGMH